MYGLLGRKVAFHEIDLVIVVPTKRVENISEACK